MIYRVPRGIGRWRDSRAVIDGNPFARTQYYSYYSVSTYRYTYMYIRTQSKEKLLKIASRRALSSDAGILIIRGPVVFLGHFYAKLSRITRSATNNTHTHTHTLWISP